MFANDCPLRVCRVGHGSVKVSSLGQIFAGANRQGSSGVGCSSRQIPGDEGTASRIEAHSVRSAIHCTEATAVLLQPAFSLEARGAVQIDGKGEMYTFLLSAQ